MRFINDSFLLTVSLTQIWFSDLSGFEFLLA